MAKIDLVIANARVGDGADVVDIAVSEGHIAAIAEDAIGEALISAANSVWDARGHLVLPGLVDIHTHLDKTFIEAPNGSGTLGEAIVSYDRVRQSLTRESYAVRMNRALELAALHGVTALRTHINARDEFELLACEVALDMKAKWRDRLDVQIVALGNPTASDSVRAHMEMALQMGVDYLGGAPSLTPDPHASVDVTFELAEKHGKLIDLHIDETEDSCMCALEYLAEQAAARGHAGRVTAGHCVSLTFLGDADAARVMDKIAEAEMNIVTLPSCNLVLMGRNMQPAPRGVTRVKELLARGVNVSAASDNVGDPFNPFGAYDPLHIANLNAHVAHLTGDEELLTSLKMVTEHPARVMGVSTGRVEVGAPADLVVVECARARDAITQLPARLATFKRGRLVVETTVETKWR